MLLVHSVRTGLFLGFRSLRRGNPYVAILITLILTLIFLNLVAIGGLLVGLIKGSENGFVKYYSGTVVIEPLLEKNYTQFTEEVLEFAKKLPDFVAYSPRLMTGVTLSNQFKERKVGQDGDSVSASIVGIDPEMEMQTTSIADKIIEGRFLEPGDRDAIILGANLAGRGATLSIGESLRDVYVGDKIMVTYPSGAQREYTLVGIYKTKVAVLNLKGMVSLPELKDVLNVTDERYSQIAIKTVDSAASTRYVEYFHDAGFDEYNLIKSWPDVLGSAVRDVNTSFEIIGNIIGGIGLMVGAITIFILIFVNAVSKRRFIGILKANGISGVSVIISYVIQGLFYTTIATVVGMMILYLILVPYVSLHPIDFPFADGILYVTNDYVGIRVAILFFVSAVSGFFPAFLITRENTLNAILGR